MRISVTLDDALLADTKDLTGIEDIDALIHEALTELVQRAAQRRMIELGGSAPDLVAPPRRRFGAE